MWNKMALSHDVTSPKDTSKKELGLINNTVGEKY